MPLPPSPSPGSLARARSPRELVETVVLYVLRHAPCQVRRFRSLRANCDQKMCEIWEIADSYSKFRIDRQQRKYDIRRTAGLKDGTQDAIETGNWLFIPKFEIRSLVPVYVCSLSLPVSYSRPCVMGMAIDMGILSRSLSERDIGSSVSE